MWNKIFILLFVATSAHADPGQFTFLEASQPAPFQGTLFDPHATARILANNKFLKEEYNLKLSYELNKQEATFNLQLEQLNITLESERSRYETTLDIKNTEIEQLNKIIAKKPGKGALVWGTLGGFAAGIAATVAITYAVNK